MKLSKKEELLNTWLLHKQWLKAEELQEYLKHYLAQNYISLSFLEWLLQEKKLTIPQFENALQEDLHHVLLYCSSCEKSYLGKLQTLASCSRCKGALSLKTGAKPDSRLGTTLGACILTRKLGQGAMGKVYLAYHQRLEKWVALKLLPRSEVEEEGQERFFLEARTIGALEHPHLVNVLDVGESEECFYMVQPFIEGQSLQKLLDQHGSLQVEQILPLLEGICKGLEYAHHKGVIHRDIKPDNIMRTQDGEPKIVDFGLAKMRNTTKSLSPEGSILGTPHYMSPEQASGSNVDPRSDIYSLGIVLFQMLTGVLPYQSDSPMAILLKHVNDPPPQILDFLPNLDPRFAQIVSKCLAKKPEDRFQTCKEILDCLQRYSSGSWKELPLAPPSSISPQTRSLQILGLALLVILAIPLFLFYWLSPPFPSPLPSLSSDPEKPNKTPSSDPPSPPQPNRSNAEISSTIPLALEPPPETKVSNPKETKLFSLVESKEETEKKEQYRWSESAFVQKLRVLEGLIVVDPEKIPHIASFEDYEAQIQTLLQMLKPYFEQESTSEEKAQKALTTLKLLYQELSSPDFTLLIFCLQQGKEGKELAPETEKKFQRSFQLLDRSLALLEFCVESPLSSGYLLQKQGEKNIWKTRIQRGKSQTYLPFLPLAWFVGRIQKQGQVDIEYLGHFFCLSRLLKQEKSPEIQKIFLFLQRLQEIGTLDPFLIQELKGDFAFPE